MRPASLPASPIADLRTVELDVADAPLLQAFFEANQDYFETVQGEPPVPGQARDELAGRPPEGMPYSHCRHLGHVDAQGRLAAYAGVIAGLLAPEVCHVGLFIVDAGRHGRGDAAALYDSLEDWARRQGAAWMRLGVVVGNRRAERFWSRRGFVESRLREGIVMGRRVNTVRAMFKPLAGGTRQEYLALVARDRVDAP